LQKIIESGESMIYNKLGNSKLRVSLLAYGSWALSKTGWKGVNQNEAIKTLELALENGINFIDTAPIYGFGKSEEIIGNVCKSIRKKLVIATKTGLKWTNFGKVSHDLSYDFIMSDIENSLKRLKTDYIDLYQIHWPDPNTKLEETFSTLNNLKKSGVIKYIGVSNFSLNQLKYSIDLVNIVSIQNQYNLLQKEVEKEILPYCSGNNISVLAYSPLAQGLLSGTFDRNYVVKGNDIRRFNPLFSNKDTFKTLDNIDKKLPDYAFEYLYKNGVSSILVSMTKEKHLMENLKIIEQIKNKSLK